MPSLSSAPLKEHRFCGETGDGQVTGRRHRHRVGRTGEVILLGAALGQINEDVFPGVTERLNGAPQVLQASPAGIQMVDSENNGAELLVLTRPAQKSRQAKQVRRGWTSKRQKAQDTSFGNMTGELYLKGVIRLVPSGEARNKIDGPKNATSKAAEQEAYHNYGTVYAPLAEASKGSIDCSIVVIQTPASGCGWLYASIERPTTVYTFLTIKKSSANPRFSG